MGIWQAPLELLAFSAYGHERRGSTVGRRLTGRKSLVRPEQSPGFVTYCIEVPLVEIGSHGLFDNSAVGAWQEPAGEDPSTT